MKANTLKKCLAALLMVMLVLSVAACAPAQTSSQGAASTGATSSKTETPASSEATSSKEDLYYNVEGYPICDETITVTIMGANASSYQPDWNELLEIKKIEEKFGIKLQGTVYSRDAWPNQLTMMLTSDKLPDAIINGEMGDAGKIYGAQGYFVDLNDYKELMPNLFGIIEESPAVGMAMKDSEGAIYCVGRIITDKLATATGSAPLWIDNEWLKNVGKEKPTTTDELLDVLRAFRDQDANGNGDPNDEIPLGAFCNWSYAYFARNMQASFGLNTVGSALGGSDVDMIVDDNGKVQLAWATDEYKEYMKFLVTLYQEKLLDQEFFVMTDAQFNEKKDNAETEVYGALFYADFTRGSTDFNMDYVIGLSSDICAEPKLTMSRCYANSGNDAISVKSEYKEALCRLFDYFHNEDNITEFYEGVQWTWEPNTVKGYEHIMVRDSKPLTVKHGYEETKTTEFIYTKGMIQNGFQNMVQPNTSWQLSLEYDELVKLRDALWADPSQKSNVAALVALTAPGVEFKDVYPALPYSAEQIDEMSSIKLAINNYHFTAMADFMLGKKDVDAEWDNYIQQFKNMGLEKLLQIEQEVYDAVA